MDAHEAQKVALLRAVEETDTDGELLPLEQRHSATREAGGQVLDPPGEGGRLGVAHESFLAARAQELAPVLEGLKPGAGAAKWMGLAVAGVLLLCLAIGVLSDRLGGHGVINIIAFPLLGLLAWNVLMYALMLVGGLFSKSGEPGGSWLARLLQKSGKQAAGLEGQVQSRFWSLWLPLNLPSRSAQARVVLHAAAAAAATGIVAGMYIRGLGVRYEAGWESTFLDAESLRTFFNALFWPARALTGFRLGLPGLGDIGKAEFNDDESFVAMGAGDWIHLYALTTLLVIIVPRLVLSGIFWMRGRAAAASIILQDGWVGYTGRLLGSVEGGDVLVRVVPVSFSPASKTRDALRRLIANEWGGAAVVEFLDPVPYGAEEAFVGGLTAKTPHLVFLATLTTTPEDEAHRFIVEKATAKLEELTSGGRQLVVIDISGFKDRFNLLPEYGRRLGQRAGTWAKVLKPTGVPVLTLEPGATREWALDLETLGEKP